MVFGPCLSNDANTGTDYQGYSTLEKWSTIFLFSPGPDSTAGIHILNNVKKEEIVSQT